MIAFFGPDGSGKTSLARALAGFLAGRGFRVRVSWMRGSHTFASLLARFLSCFQAFRGCDNVYYGIRIPGGLRRLWQLIEFTSVLPVFFARFLVPELLGYTVICERYLPDFVVWVALSTRDPRYLGKSEARFLLVLSMKVDAVVYVAASVEELAERRRGEVDFNHLRRQVVLYDRVSEVVGAVKLDTTGKSVVDSFRELVKVLEPRVSL